MILITCLRSLAFYVLSVLLALPFLLLLPGLVLPRAVALAVTGVYLRLQLRLLAVVCGVRYRLQGLENLPDGPCLIASQHESAWETLYFQVLLDRPVMFAKKEVFQYPLLGLLARKIGHIPVDRGGSADAVRDGFRRGRDVAATGRKILVFPTGTRGTAGEGRMMIQTGVGVLYQLLDLPAVPVLLNSGRCWPAKSLLKHPGTITVQILPPIAAGQDRHAFLQRLGDDLNRPLAEAG
ncbi:lysophospholipid acyltransferase family protein [Shimia sp.]|uniref:lysophospholipid acyltransferase family protein n=1 Tax=Shimia sp. TaxID=1954381 RepID=UPI00356707F6